MFYSYFSFNILYSFLCIIYKPTQYYQQSVCSICDNSNLFDDTGDFPTFLEKQNPVHLLKNNNNNLIPLITNNIPGNPFKIRSAQEAIT